LNYGNIGVFPFGVTEYTLLLLGPTALALSIIYASTFFVIFKVPLGVVMALTACFAGLGFRRLRTRKENL
jgi:hypothetical protein